MLLDRPYRIYVVNAQGGKLKDWARLHSRDAALAEARELEAAGYIVSIEKDGERIDNLDRATNPS